MSQETDGSREERRREDAWRRLTGVGPQRSIAGPVFFLALAVFGIALLYLVILALADASIATALPLVVMTMSAGALALWGWQRDRTAALRAFEKQGRAELHNRRLRRKLVELHHAREALADPSDVPAMIVQIATGLLEAEKGMLLTPVRGAAELEWEVTADVGLGLETLRSPTILRVVTVAYQSDRAAREDRPPSQRPDGPDAIGRDLRNLVALPIYVSDIALGIVVCANRPGGFAAFDDDILLALGDQAGAVLENGRLQAELRDSYVSVVRMLAETIRVKDPELRTHSQEVSDYVVAVARRLGMGAEPRERLRFGSLLHDVGKIAISERILLKPGPLDDEEWEQVRLHPEIGSRLLREVPSLAPLADAVLHHHERWDGRGYPGGLAGEQIPLEARIIGVADAFSAMTSDRSYRPAMSVDEACGELERSAGSHFDPEVVTLFVSEVRRTPSHLTAQPVGVATRGLAVERPGPDPLSEPA